MQKLLIIERIKLDGGYEYDRETGDECFHQYHETETIKKYDITETTEDKLKNSILKLMEKYADDDEVYFRMEAIGKHNWNCQASGHKLVLHESGNGRECKICGAVIHQHVQHKGE